MFKTPSFWTKRNFISIALTPLSLVYYFGFSLAKFLGRPQKISKPVICIGNVIAGGSGKTPTAIAIGKILNEININFAFLSRGYMNDGSKFLMLSKHDKNKVEQVGDEPLILAETAPTFVAKDRLFGARQIESIKKFQAIILDDGMQCNSIKRDFTIMVVDGKIGFGNEFMLPAGPMRETLDDGLKKADLVVVIGDSNDELLQKLSTKKIIRARVTPLNLDRFQNKKIIAFCGLAYPQKFFSLLTANKLNLVESHSFADHYRYLDSDLQNLVSSSAKKDATLLTTKKDWVKFPQSFQDKIEYLDIDLVFENKAELTDELKKIFK